MVNKKIIIYAIPLIMVIMITAYTPDNYSNIQSTLRSGYTPNAYTNIESKMGEGENATSTTCSCPSVNTNWAVNLADYCIITTGCELGTGNLSFINAGNFTCNSNINVSQFNKTGLNSGDVVYIKSSCLLNIG